MRGICALVMGIVLVTSSAFAGTANFAGSNNDRDAHLQGHWVAYEANGIASALSDADPAQPDSSAWSTTNLTSLCGGPKTLVDMGTITWVLEYPNWNWSAWWGCWTTLDFTVGGVTKMYVGFGPPFDWAPYDWVYIGFGDPDAGGLQLAWNQDYFGAAGLTPANEPLAIRLTSDAGTLTLAASKNGVTFVNIPGASWSINDMPGGLGDMSSTALNVEMSQIGGQAATISLLQWKADSVPDLNSLQPVAGCTDGTTSTVDAMLRDFHALFYPTFMPGVVDAPDHNWDNMADPYELALVARAICNNAAVASAYAANLDIAKQLVANDYWGWGYTTEANGQFATQIAAEALWDDAKGAINWYFWVFDPEATQLQSMPALTPAGDYDGDGFTNLEEYNFVIAQSGSPEDYVIAATGGLAGPGLPVVGLLGLGLMAAGFACSGVATARRKK